MGEPLRLLAAFPQPDDKSLGMGPTLAKYAAEDVETFVRIFSPVSGGRQIDTGLFEGLQ